MRSFQDLGNVNRHALLEWELYVRMSMNRNGLNGDVRISMNGNGDYACIAFTQLSRIGNVCERSAMGIMTHLQEKQCEEELASIGLLCALDTFFFFLRSVFMYDTNIYF